MAQFKKRAGQRANASSASGQKRRSPTSTPHTGSRQEPSHELEHDRGARAKKSNAAAMKIIKTEWRKKG